MGNTRDSFHDEIYTDPHTGMQYRVDYYVDHDSGPPQRVSDGHGVVTEQGFDLSDPEVRELIAESATEDMAMRMPLFKLLHANRGHFLYYDTVASISKAIHEWGCKPEEAPAAVEQDYEYLRGWYDNDWHYMTIQVTKLDEDGEETDDWHSIGGYESTLLKEEAQLSFVLDEMAWEIESNVRAELHKNQLELPLI